MTLTDDQRAALVHTWSAFDDREITYVVLRGYTELPDSITGSDLDILVAPDSFEDAVSFCKHSFASSESIPQNAFDLALLVANRPRAVARDVARAPTEMVATAKNRLVASEVTGRGHVERTFDAAGLQLHLVNHLAYRSPMNGANIRVDPAIEDAMFEHRTRNGAFYTPAPPDQLAHLVCRGVFDYEGDFPDRYVARSDQLFEEVTTDADALERFHDLLSQIFFQADTLVYQHIEDGAYDEIRSSLRQYSDY